ncbi:HPr family phosphocarrier protein [Arcanobacterium bovis]|uniref:Phosphocarrier protein HPr n=1 Tax=Arcanobacterium bovis TaxID=2529275 RepID=A0A4Q9V1T8_9ACTO|nr:HPr family phosphocarrier protein [Arcanobacterium bovis]TBW23595.1 HPr family phosphocarrier protein [Arcanobacterium bovis]
MATRTAKIASAVGLHARPAALFTQAVEDSGLDVEISLPGEEPVDAASVLEVMTLGAQCGDEVTLSAEGENAEQVLESLAHLLETDLDA